MFFSLLPQNTRQEQLKESVSAYSPLQWAERDVRSEAAGYFASAVRTERAMNGHTLLSPFDSVWAPAPWIGASSILGFPTSVNLV